MPYRAQIAAARGPLAGFIAMGLFWGAFAALVPALKAGIDAGDAVFGGLLLGGAVAAVAAMLTAPRLGSLLGGATLPVLVAAFALAAALPGLVGGALGFGLALVLVGATAGSLDVLMNARLSAIEAARRMPLMNLAHATYSFTYAGAALATGAAREAGLGAGPVLAVVAALMLALTLLAVERGARIDGLARPAPGAAGLGAVPLIAGLVILIGFLSEHSAEAWSALHIERTLGGSAAEGALGPALLGLTMGVGRLFGQAVAARVPERRLLRGALVVAAAGAALAAVAPAPSAAYAGFAVLGLGASLLVPTGFALIGRLAAPEARARAIARAAALGYMGFFFGPALLGLTAEFFGLRAAFGLVAAILLAGLGLVALLGRFDRPRG
jgi:hypothetical protein